MEKSPMCVTRKRVITLAIGESHGAGTPAWSRPFTVDIIRLAGLSFLALSVGCQGYHDKFRGKLIGERRINEVRQLGSAYITSANWNSQQGNLVLQISRDVIRRFDLVRQYERVCIASRLERTSGRTEFSTLDVQIGTRFAFLASPFLLPIEINNHAKFKQEEREAIAAIRNGADESMAKLRQWTGRVIHYKYYRVVDGYTEEITRDQTTHSIEPLPGAEVRVWLVGEPNRRKAARTNEHGHASVAMADLVGDAAGVAPRQVRVSVRVDGCSEVADRVRIDLQRGSASIE